MIKFDLQFFGGRGGSSGGGGGGNKVAQSLASIEDRIKGDSVETAALVSESGEILFDKSEGLANVVHFTQEEVAMMRDNTLTHNHPSSNTFSSDDVNLIVSSGLHEIRAVTPEGTVYSLTRNYGIGEAIPTSYMKFGGNYKKAVDKYVKGTVDKIWAETGNANLCNKMVSDYRRQWLSNNSSKYGMTYKEVTP